MHKRYTENGYLKAVSTDIKYVNENARLNACGRMELKIYILG